MSRLAFVIGSRCSLVTEVGEAISCWCRAVCLYLTSAGGAGHTGCSIAADAARDASSSGNYSPTGVTPSGYAAAAGDPPTCDTSSGESPTGYTSSGESPTGYTSPRESPSGDSSSTGGSSTSDAFTSSADADPNTGDAVATSAVGLLRLQVQQRDPVGRRRGRRGGGRARPRGRADLLLRWQEAPSPPPAAAAAPPGVPTLPSSGASESASALPGIVVTGGAFGYDELSAAADGFSESNLLGQGGFGQVYKGTVRGQEVAIKKLRSGSGQGEREFRAEVEIISRVHHKNLVSLVGYCIYGEQRLLVYEYVPNKTLEFHLHGSGRPALDWPRRWKIAVGSAKGLAYLHEDCHPKIIHRDIKAANILLDYTFEPKVADFGLAKYQAAEQTAVSTRVMGTFGYLAPEYAATGKVNDRSDVFSFGVMLLELITGKKPIMMSHGDQPDTLVAWAKPLLGRAVDEGIFDELVDPRLENNFDSYDMERLIACAAAAVRHTARSRPRMSQIVRYLEGELAAEDLNAGVTPGQSAMQRTGGGTTDQMRRLKKMAFGSVTGTGTVSEYTSSEFSEPTSEYGLNPSTEYTSSAAGGDTGEVTVDVQRTAGGASGEVTGTERLSRRTTASRQAGRGGRV
uniref:non-specific serine/threonine protein kinase n=1 Tax=Oryza brachyantha TaxID=4533 RepID=J3L437_ORYBR